MAQSPAHRFGQIIGDVLEAATLPLLEKFASDHSLYLDRKGPRPCRRGKKCSWLDLNGNSHDLDYVLERGGSADRFGIPVAFIEVAWRRYTKHSRNKAQEIQGAVLPLAETYRHSSPFKGAIVAGVFTDGALNQLRSLGFSVLYFPYDTVVTVFLRFGIDARFTETTSDTDFQAKVQAYQSLPASKRKRLAAALFKAHQSEVRNFMDSLSSSASRQIDRLIILALHGASHEALTIDDAVRFIEKYSDDGREKPVDRYEIEVRYNNGDSIHAKFKDKFSAIDFLRSYQPVAPNAR